MYGIWDRHSRLPVRQLGDVANPGARGKWVPFASYNARDTPGTHTGGTRVVWWVSPRHASERNSQGPCGDHAD